MKLLTSILCIALMQDFSRPDQAAPSHEGGQSRGKSTSLGTIIALAVINKIPLGLILGSKPILCDRAAAYDTRGMTPTEALSKAVQGTGYTAAFDSGVIRITGPDLTPQEQEVVSRSLPDFSAPPATMADLGARLSGYIHTEIEGADGFLFNTLGNPSDEIVSVSGMNNKSAPQIADEIISKRSKGIWVMRPLHTNDQVNKSSTEMRIFSYHDDASIANKLACAKVYEP